MQEPLTQNEVSSLSELINQHKTVLYKFCLYLTRHPDRAEDLFQQTWVRVIEKIDTYNPSRPFDNWLITIASNLYRDECRKVQRRSKFISDSHDLEFYPSPSPSPEEQIQDSHHRQKLQHCINRLEDIFRIPLLLFYSQGKRYREIAGILGIPTGTVKSRINNARNQLKTMLEEGDRR